MKKNIAVLFLSIASLVAFGQSSTNLTAHLIVKEESLGKLLPGAESDAGSSNKLFSSKRVYSLTTDASFKHVAYVVKRDGKEMAVVDGVLGKAYDKVAEKEEMYFSPDGKHLAYVVKRGEKKLVVQDGVEGKEYDAIDDLFNPVFSPDSQQLAYIATIVDKVKQRMGLWDLKDYVVVNGVEGKSYENIEGIIFSPDSKKVAYCAQPTWNRSSRVVVNGVEGKQYTYAWRTIFSPDSQHMAYVAHKRNPDRAFAVIDSKEGESYEGNSPIGDIIFSPDSSHSAYLVRAGGNKIVRDGVPMSWLGLIQDHCLPIFSPDSRHFAYVSHGTSWMIVMDDKIYDDQQVRRYTRNLTFSPDGKHLAYITRFDSPTNTGYDFPVIDGVVQKKFDNLYGVLRFSPDSKRIAYLIKRGEKTVPVYGEFAGGEYDQFVTCDPDLNTKHMSGERSVPFVFDQDGTLHAIVLRDGELFRLELKIVEE